MSACKKDETSTPEPTKKAIPSSSSNISLVNFTIGTMKLLNEGNDGYTSDGQQLIANGYVINGTESGGIGNTYAVKTSNGEVLLRWRANLFAEFIVNTGWTGMTEQGVKLGDLLASVQAKYPTLVLLAPYSDVYEIPTTGKIHVHMEFSLTTTALEYIDVTYIP
ncbi:MAG: hypothetical protein NTX91_02860 [candidate division SR1 bacterium]|nr:hypothetical protein [candidate division SR1 bacterium]